MNKNNIISEFLKELIDHIESGTERTNQKFIDNPYIKSYEFEIYCKGFNACLNLVKRTRHIMSYQLEKDN